MLGFQFGFYCLVPLFNVGQNTHSPQALALIFGMEIGISPTS